MHTTKYFLMAALALMTAACSNDDNDILTPAEQPAKSEGITITAQLAPKSSVSGTRKVTEGTGAQAGTIVAEWEVNEHLAILYSKDGNQMADARIKSVDASGNATIEFTVVEGTADNTYCEIIYPYSAARTDKSGRKSNSALLSNQDGTLSANLDVRYGAGKIQVTTPGLDVTTQPQAQFAIWKLTLDKTAKDLYITANGELIAGATLASAGTEFTVAVPQFENQTIAVVANDESNNCYYFSKASVTIAAGKYYQSSPTMTALDGDNSKPLYKIMGSSSVTIPSGRTVVLSGVNISSGSITCNGSVTMILLGANTVTAAASKAAIQISSDKYTTLTITGSGSLTAKGGKDAAGIGTNVADETTLSGGNIVINGGTVHATGGEYAAGIGTGYATNNGKNTCGTITINGGMVYATGSSSAAGIGTGSSLDNATQTCGTITINGGTVTANGGVYAAGIGTGVAASVRLEPASNECGAITIGTGVTGVIATKGNYSPNSIGFGIIGTGGTQTCGTITFGTAQVFDGTAATGTWTPNPMVAGTYGGLNLVISTTTNTDDTWTLTPVAP